MKLGNLPRCIRLCRSSIIPNFQMVSLTFSRSKKIRCCFWMLASLMEVSNLTTGSIVDLRLLNPHRELVCLLDSRNQTNLLLTIRSIVLQRQLVSAIGWYLAGFEPYLPGLGIGIIVTIYLDNIIVRKLSCEFLVGVFESHNKFNLSRLLCCVMF